jgi:hypothetical protein
MKIPRILLAGLLVSLAASQSAPAASIVGSLAIGTINGAQIPAGQDLNSTTSITWTGTIAQSTGLGNLNIIAGGDATGGSSTLDLTNLTSFTYHFTGGTTATDYGTFTAGAGSFIVSRTATDLSVYLLGNFAPTTTAGAPLAGFTSGPASLSFSFTLASPTAALGGTASLNSPPATPPGFIPEPASLALIGIGIVSVTAFRSLRKRIVR